MLNSTNTGSRSPAPSGGAITRASTDARNDSAQPSLTSGFGAVIEKEQDLRSATEGSFGRFNGPHSADLDRILHHQHSQLSANIALLEQRYESLPKPERFMQWHERARPPVHPRRVQPDEIELLPGLVAQHTRLLADIDALIACAPDGQRGELILTEVSRRHEEMAWMLTALLKDDESTSRIAQERSGRRNGESIRAQENWDNEGGPVRLDPPAS
jgi:hypothetical protein